MLPVVLVLLFAATDLPPVRQHGLASGYAAWKKEYIYARGSRIQVSTGKPFCWWFKKVKPGQAIVAHRSLPCGTKVYVTTRRTGKGAWLTVGDRGPYGACVRKTTLFRWMQGLTPKKRREVTWKPSTFCSNKHEKGFVWYVKKHARWPGTWRGVLDISHTARRLIGHNGFEHVTIRYMDFRRVAMLATGGLDAR